VLCAAHQSISAWAVISGPLSQRMCVGATDRDECLQHFDGLIGGDAAGGVHDQRLPGELVDDVQQLQCTAVGGLVKLEVKRPHVPGALGTKELLGRSGIAEPATLAGALRDP
jgi:hypothetical protein